MKKLQINKNKYCLVDDEDYEWLSQHNWFESYGYAVTNLKTDNSKKRVFMHRLIMKTPRNKVTDHINGNQLDNRKSNLRICTVQQNSTNQKKKPGKTSQFKGVCKLPNKLSDKWKTSTSFKYKKLEIGRFDNEHHAALAYDLWATFLFGEYAKTNFKVVSSG